MTTKTIQKATSRGQITLPVAWRKKFNTNQFLMEAEESFLKIVPIDTDDLGEYEVVFDAARDNDGKGILGRDLIKMIQKIDG
ncbi:MAG: hypothetical protein A2249_00895 [Candidatus Jacksonbacteria bacterium RIFOXYA2_FULL_44_7]|uniref:SpoVT-AbrB domain-containing protein n=1 Tax=Candidatus Jacksonbacteria bacterium RIFCSPLOWO2_02_FULL_44_20 TaxID=1798460 RepID=A0A1G2A6Y2_9BACT|nr:MAG: hypothetical protein UW39_C0012G0025 [Parcubacteria group bacterium GW2011_GWC2_44_17]OGY70342.1 MAG: hypothetical protein A3C00_01575 [Candidatus Jacksonbacteria bacterium RIFCSPHIGHO2_02_FULL_44_25]OGY72429.1 MAG: hypothetical protein A3H61_05220 [Candidatus Jacksonbacteria bacterium RIFCSPLOWO2_02_FULL_44_20]OGY72580.1 MAG: hypothetical protein A3E05_01865 [Candidatus Jacksonbacteria bacterium RIFCSPHIGHO2_12_FULL_44_12]OGY73414.1 MAG: hypothetical protein A3H07_00655 [Candidatus Jac